MAVIMLLSIALPMTSVSAASGNEAVDMNWTSSVAGPWTSASDGDTIQVNTGETIDLWMNATGLAASTDYILGFQLDDTATGVAIDTAQIPFNSGASAADFSNMTSQTLQDGCTYSMSVMLGEDTGGAMPSILVQNQLYIEVGNCGGGGGGGGSGQSVSIEGNVPMLGWLVVDGQTIDVSRNDTLETRATSSGLKTNDHYELEVTIYDDPSNPTTEISSWNALSETSTEYLNYTVPDVCTIGISVILRVMDGATGNFNQVANTGAQLNVTDCTTGGSGGGGPSQGPLTAGPTCQHCSDTDEIDIEWMVDNPNQDDYVLKLEIFAHNSSTNTSEVVYWHNETFVGSGEVVMNGTITIAPLMLSSGCYYASVSLYRMVQGNPQHLGHDGGGFGINVDCDGPGPDGDDNMIVHNRYWMQFDVDGSGIAHLSIGVVSYMTPSLRNVIDGEMGDGDGIVSDSEALALSNQIIGEMRADDVDADYPMAFLDDSDVGMMPVATSGHNATIVLENVTGPVDNTEPIQLHVTFIMEQHGVDSNSDHWVHVPDDGGDGPDDDEDENASSTYEAHGASGWYVVDANVDNHPTSMAPCIWGAGGDCNHLYMEYGAGEGPGNMSVKFAKGGDDGGCDYDSLPQIASQSGNLVFSVDSDGFAHLNIAMEELQPVELRAWIDQCPMLGNGDGNVNMSEATAFEAMINNDDDDGDGDGDFFDHCDLDVDRMNENGENGLYWCVVGSNATGDWEEFWWYVDRCEEIALPVGWVCTDDDHDDPEFFIDGVAMIESNFTADAAGVTGDVNLTTTPVLQLNGHWISNGTVANQSTHTITAPDNDPDHNDDNYSRTYVISGSGDWVLTNLSYLSHGATAVTPPTVATIDASGVGTISHAASELDAQMYTMVFTNPNFVDPGPTECPDGQVLNAIGVCEDEAGPGDNTTNPDNTTTDPVVNTLPECTTSYSLASTVDLMGTTVDVRHEGGTTVTAPLNGAFTVMLPAGEYWMMVECTDADGDNLTLTITEGGTSGQAITVGSNFYAEAGFTLTDGMVGGGTTITVDWSDGTDNGRMILNIEVASVDEIVSVIEDESGSAIPGFTGIIGVLSLLGAAILAKRRD